MKTSPISPPTALIDEESMNVDFSMMDNSFSDNESVKGIPLSTPETPKLIIKSPSLVKPSTSHQSINVPCFNSFSILSSDDDDVEGTTKDLREWSMKTEETDEEEEQKEKEGQNSQKVRFLLQYNLRKDTIKRIKVKTNLFKGGIMKRYVLILACS